jgi:uncharacterized protein (DUF1330 family)
MVVSMKRFSPLVIAAIFAVNLGPCDAVYARGGHSNYHPRGVGTPIYFVVDIEESAHADEFDNMFQKTQSTLAQFNGRVVIDSISISSLDGPASAKFVVIQFDSVEKAKQWLASSDGKDFEEVRRRATKSLEFMVVGRPTEVGLALGGRSSAARQEMMKIRDEEIKRLTGICKGC